MKSLFAGSVAASALVVGLWFGLGQGASPEKPVSPGEPVNAASPLIVHEWGTFTSFSGSDGKLVGFRPNNQDLPNFVYTAGWGREFQIRPVGGRRHGEHGNAGDLFLQRSGAAGVRAGQIPVWLDHGVVSPGHRPLRAPIPRCVIRRARPLGGMSNSWLGPR